MKAQDFFTRSEFESAKVKLDNREWFELIGKVGAQKITFHSIFVNPQTAKSIWNGIEYLLSIGEMHKDGGCGYATTDYSCFDNWQSFLRIVDDTLDRRPGYVTQNDSDIQMSMF